MSDPKPIYPVTPETLHAYAASIFTPIRNGESVTTVWPPMAGRRLWNKFIIEHTSLFSEELPNFEKYLLVYVEPLDLTEESLSGYLQLIGSSLCSMVKQKGIELSKEYSDVFLNGESSYSKLLSELRSMIHEVVQKGYEVVLFFGEFDELDFANTIFYHNLKSLWSNLYPGLHYIFLMRERVTRDENVEQWGELNEVILQNTLYLPLLNEKDTDYLFDQFSKSYGVEVSSDLKKRLLDLCGGHPYLLKVCFRVLGKNDYKSLSLEEVETLIGEYYEIKSVARGILNVRSENEKTILRKIAVGDQLTDIENLNSLEFLVSIGMIAKKDSRYVLFSHIFRQALLTSKDHKPTTKERSFEYVSENNEILLEGSTIEEKFTHQEYMILCEFLKSQGKLMTRDDIGAVLWGQESYEKYSDWAIDQLMSKLRKKLGDLKVKEKLVTIRGKGYKIIS